MRHVAALAASAARPIIFREAAYFAVLACARVSIRARRPALDKEGLCDGARFVVVLNAQPTKGAAVWVPICILGGAGLRARQHPRAATSARQRRTVRRCALRGCVERAADKGRGCLCSPFSPQARSANQSIWRR